MNVRIGVFSDTHGNISPADRFLAALKSLDAVFHLGDYASDAQCLGLKFNCPFYAVRGNCDYYTSNEPVERVVELGSKRFYLTHGHRYSSEYALELKAKENGCDAILFGHTHTPLLTAQGKLLICNPGSLSQPRFSHAPSCALITIGDGELYIKMLSSESSVIL